MTTSHFHRRIWAAAISLVVTQAAFAQDPPVAAPTQSPISAPAFALTPIPMSEYVLQQPAPAPVVEQAGYAPAQMSPPATNLAVTNVNAPTIDTSMRKRTTPQSWGPNYPSVGNMGAPTWRWYGWGAPSPQGFAPSSMPITQSPPAPSYSPPAITPHMPPAITPPAPSEAPKVNVPVVPMMDPVDDPTWAPALTAPQAAPSVGPPAVDLTPAPKPVAAPANTGPNVDPWTGIPPTGAKAATEWRTVRASSAK